MLMLAGLLTVLLTFFRFGFLKKDDTKNKVTRINRNRNQHTQWLIPILKGLKLFVRLFRSHVYCNLFYNFINFILMSTISFHYR